MGYAKRLEDDKSSSTLNEPLLMATMGIIGLQAHVHMKDGSVFSGILYTASVENDFGIILKNAKATKKGTRKANVANGTVVETLVILSSDIVQILSGGVLLPENVAGNTEGEDVGSATETSPSEPQLRTANKSIKVAIEGRGNRHRRHGGTHILKRGEQIHQDNNVDIQSSSSSLESMHERVNPIEEDRSMPEPCSNGLCHALERPSSTDNSLSRSSTLDESSELCEGLVPSSNASVPIQAVKKGKEFKLNPEAKIFSPSYTKRLSPSPAPLPDIANIPYIPSHGPILPVPEAVYPEVGNNPFMPHASPPSKFVPYTNLTASNAGGGYHFPQHMIGPTVNRAQPQRFPSPYHGVQAAPMLVNPNPQVMVSRSGQLVYIQPVSQDLIQGTPPLSPMLSRPLPTAQQVQYLKHQGLVTSGQPLQICINQPFTASGPQPYTVPSHIPVMQPPFPTNQPMTVAVPNGFYGTKFP